MELLIDAARQGKRIRLIGDNLNFMTGVKEESRDSHQHMVHMFASAALVSDHYFLDKPNVPEIPITELGLDNILLSKNEYAIIRNDCVKLVADIISQFIPVLGFLKSVVPSEIEPEYSKAFDEPTIVIPLPVLPFNEQAYQDDVKILDYYESFFQKIMAPGGDSQFQIGGDQLTRERFSQAKLLRLGNLDPQARFARLGVITMEFFHLGMNYLEKVIYRSLWNTHGNIEVGTMHGEAERIIRHSIDLNVMKAYQADKDFAISFLTAYVIEAAMTFFGMENRNSQPTCNAPPKFTSEEEKKTWVYSTLGKMIDGYVFPAWSGHDTHEYRATKAETVQEFISVPLANGQLLKIPIQVEVLCPKKPDKVKDYGHYVLETCMTFWYFLNVIKCPDRSRLLPLFKMMMLQMKATNTKAKYPLELLRLLVQQYSLLPLQQACQVLQACFVNTKGKRNSHVPADLQMEWIVRDNKRHIKHMFANKSMANIEIKSAAIPMVATIGENFDKTAGVVKRAKAHKKKGAESDELSMMDDLRKLKPFEHVARRAFEAFRDIKLSPIKKLDAAKFHEWFSKHKDGFTP